jgi:hypothetical protein
VDLDELNFGGHEPLPDFHDEEYAQFVRPQPAELTAGVTTVRERWSSARAGDGDRDRGPARSHCMDCGRDYGIVVSYAPRT